MEIEGAQHPYGLKIESAPGAESYAPVNGIRFHVANAAGFSEAITKETEVGRHPAKMEGDARDTTADLARGPRGDRRLDRRPGSSSASTRAPAISP